MPLIKKTSKGGLELGAKGYQGEFAACWDGVVGPWYKELADEWIFRAIHHKSQVDREGVVVLVNKILGVVADGARKMADNETFVIL